MSPRSNCFQCPSIKPDLITTTLKPPAHPKPKQEPPFQTNKMQFTTTVALLASLAMSVAAVPSAGGPSGMAQNLHARTPTDKMIFGRSFYCASNDPTTCCAVRLCPFLVTFMSKYGNLLTHRSDSAVADMVPASTGSAAAMAATARGFWCGRIYGKVRSF